MKRLLIVLFALLALPSLYAACADVDMQTCIDDNDCTPIEDGTGCVEAADAHEENSFCSELSETDCINVIGCVLTGNARDCVVPTESEKAQGDRFRMLKPHVTINDFRMYLEVYYPNANIFIDGARVRDVDTTYSDSSELIRRYSFPCRPGELLHLEIDSHEGELWTVYSDITHLNCAAASQEYPIRSFKLENNKYVWVMSSYFNQYYIDGEKITDVDTGYLGGAASTRYSMDCKEGHWLEVGFYNEVKDERHSSWYDISEFECKTECLTDDCDESEIPSLPPMEEEDIQKIVPPPLPELDAEPTGEEQAEPPIDEAVPEKVIPTQKQGFFKKVFSWIGSLF